MGRMEHTKDNKVQKRNQPSTLETLSRMTETSNNRKYVLRLYVAGMTRRSKQAIENITRICEQELKGRYDLEIIDIYQQPSLAAGEQIIAAPTLIKELPLPLRKFIGSLVDREKILVGLDLRDGTQS